MIHVMTGMLPRNRINLRQIEAFSAIMEAGSITGAAELLHISQPAVSRLIKDLEFRVGFQLFERRKGRIIATVEANSLHEVVQRSFSGLEKIATEAQEIRQFRSGSLRIASMPAIALPFLPRVLTAFSQENPEITLSLQIRSSTKVGEWVGAQQADIGFVSVRSPVLGTESKTLCSGPLMAVLRPDHPLAGHGPLGPPMLQDQPLIAPGAEHAVLQRIEEAFASHDIELKTRIHVQLSAAICEFARAGAGIGLVDPITAFDTSGTNLIAVPFMPEIIFHYTLLFPTNRTRPIFLDRFLDMVRSELSKNPHLSLGKP